MLSMIVVNVGTTRALTRDGELVAALLMDSPHDKLRALIAADDPESLIVGWV